MVTMSNVWDRTTEFLSDNLGAVVPLALVAIFIPVTIQGSLAPLGKTPSLAVTVQIISLLLSLVSFWGQLAIMALAIQPLAGRGAATAVATKRYPASIGIALLALLIFVVIALPVPIAMGIGGYDFPAAMAGGHPAMPASTGLFVGLYAVVAFILFVWLAARVALTTPVVLNERRGVGAIARSFELSKGLVWRIIGVIILFAIVASVAVLAAQTVFGSLLRLMIGSGDGKVDMATVLTSILVAFVQTAFTVLAAAFVARLYIAVRDARASIVEAPK